MLPLSNDVAPSVLGMPAVGEELTATGGVWANIPTDYSYQWQSATDGGGTGLANIGTNGSSYTLTGSESAKYIRVGVTASNGGGSLQVFSSYVGPVA